MPSPPPKKYRSKDIEAALTKKGFRAKDNHHTIFTLMVNDRATRIHTRISHGQQEYTDTLLALMRRQLGRLTTAEFRDLIECPMDAPAYVALLKSRFVL